MGSKNQKFEPTEKQLEYIVGSVLSKTKKISDIAVEFGFSLSAVYKLLRRNNVKFKLTDSSEKIIKLHKQGYSFKEIAELFGVSSTAIMMLIRKSDIAIEVSTENDHLISRMYSCGVPISYLCYKFNLKRKYVTSLVNNIELNFDFDNTDSRFYVYLHRSDKGEVVYVGSGCGERYKARNERTSSHLKIFNSLNKEIVKYGLTKEASLDLEEYYIREYKSDKLINKHFRVSKIVEFDIENLSSYFIYDETSPSCLRWKRDSDNKTGPRKKAGDCAGGKTSGGYWGLKFKGTYYSVHRIIYSLFNTAISRGSLIDHINNNPSDNRISNLREVTPSGNSKNTGVSISNTSGVTGISWSRGGYWRVSWNHSGKKVSKYLSPKRMFPDLDYEAAKMKCFDIAVFHRKLAEEMFYDKELEWHTVQPQNQ